MPKISPLETRLRKALLKTPKPYARITFYDHPTDAGGHWLLQGTKRLDPQSGDVSISFEHILIKPEESKDGLR